MRYRGSLAVSVCLLLCCVFAAGKDKKKSVLPVDVLQAKTVLVVVDPEAGMAVDSPMANRTAQEDVEKALMNWGRFKLAVDASDADLIITVRKGNGKIAQPTVGGVPNNNRPVIMEPSDSGGRIGGRSGTPPMAGDPSNSDPQFGGPHQQVEVGQPQDMFAVYRGKKDNPLDSSPVWRYSGENALRSPGVPAVEVFRKVIAESEKRLADNP
jgi:hypothetical protein